MNSGVTTQAAGIQRLAKAFGGLLLLAAATGPAPQAAAADEFSNALRHYLEGGPATRTQAWCAITADPADGSRLLAAYRKAQGYSRYALIVPLAQRLAAPQLADLLFERLTQRSGDAVEYYLLASALVAQTQPTPLATPPPADAAGISPTQSVSALQSRMLAIASLLADQTNDWRVRLVTAELLQRCSGPHLPPFHAPLVADDVAAVRHRAIRALAGFGPGENLPILAELLQRDPEIQLYEQLAAMRVSASLHYLPGLLQGLSNANPAVQLEAIWGLARWPRLPPEAQQAFERLAQTTRSEKVKQELKLLRNPPPSREPAETP
jgi:hypothetical protein